MSKKIVEKFIDSLAGKMFSQHIKEVIKGGSIVSFANVFAVLLGLVFSLFVARVYGSYSTGILAMVSSCMMIGFVVSSLGFGTAIQRLVPEHIAKHSSVSAAKLRKKLLKILFISGSIISLLQYIFSDYIAYEIFGNESLSFVLSLSAPFIMLLVVGKFCIQAIRSLRESKWYASFIILEPAFKVIILVTLTFFSENALNPVFSILTTSFFVFIISYIICEKVFNKKVRLDERKSLCDESFFNILKISSPMLLTSLMHIVIAETDIIMLGVMASVADVGVYSITFKIAVLSSFFLSTFNMVVAPKFSQLYHSGESEALKVMAKNIARLVVISSLPLIIIFVVCGKNILGFFGDEFIYGYTALLILLFGQLINIFSGSVGFFLNMTGHQINFNYMVTLGAILNVVLNYILIPKYGIEGAAFASMVSLSLWNIIASIYTKKEFGFYVGYIPFLSKGKSYV